MAWGGWDEENTETARRLFYDDGIPASEIAKVIGAPSRDCVMGRLNRKFGRLPEEEYTRRTGAVVVRGKKKQSPGRVPRARKSRAKAKGSKTAAPKKASHPWQQPAHPWKNGAATIKAPRPLCPMDTQVPADAVITPFRAITTKTCRWPIGDPSDSGDIDMPCCGAPASGGRYCDAHERQAYRPLSEQQSKAFRRLVAYALAPSRRRAA